MSEYEPGTVAVATVRGVGGVQVIRTCDHPYGGNGWISATSVAGTYAHKDDNLTDIRPLVVLDVDALKGKMVAPPSVEELPRWLRSLADSNRHGKDVLGSVAARLLADQIEAQTKPPRIPEPGNYGVVEAGIAGGEGRYRYVRDGSHWYTLRGAQRWWHELIDPVLVREGIE